MTLADHRRLHLQQRALDELRDRIGRDSYLSVKEVVERLNLSREKVEALPVEILPFTDFGLGTRALKRYHPADVLAVDAKLRRWQAARARGEGETYLAELRAQLEARDEAAEEMAETMNRALRGAA